MKIFTSKQIHELDEYTIVHEPVSSIDLMERAARAITNAIAQHWGVGVKVVVFAGHGNNGGDALAVARMLIEKGYNVSTFLFNISGHLSKDCAENRRRLQDKKGVQFVEVTKEFDPPKLERGMLVIDGLFGSGLNKPLGGGFASLVKYINFSVAEVVSIDMPSGLMSEDNTYNIMANIVKATLTLTLGQKKLSFLFPENQQYIGEVKVLDINLSKEGIDKTEASYTLLEENYVRSLVLPRDAYAHKGSMGKALVVAGSYGMAGAAVLATSACMRAGCGKTTVRTPRRNTPVLQTAVPEAVLRIDKDETIFSETVDTSDFNAMGIGPGIGTSEQTSMAVFAQIRRATCPVVIDADAINILANHRAWMQQLQKGLIFTPHPLELDRLEGQSTDSFERLTKARQLAERLDAYVLLKGHHTALCMPDGHIMFNSTGNAGMATAGSGDVLTGILTGLIARGYQPREACILGMYLHGLAGDLAAEEMTEECLVASDIISFMPKAFKRLLQ